MKLHLASKKEIKKAAEKKEDATDWKSNGDLGQCLSVCFLFLQLWISVARQFEDSFH